MEKYQHIGHIQSLKFILKHYPERIINVVMRKGTLSDTLTQIVDMTRDLGLHIEYWDEKRIKRLYPKAQGTIARVKPIPFADKADFYAYIQHQNHALVLLLDGVKDPQNLGAILRTAAFMGLKYVVIPSHGSVGLTEVVRNVACGGADEVGLVSMNLNYAAAELKEAGFWIYGAHEGGEASVFEEALPKKTAFVMGAEGSGIRSQLQKHCDKLLKIPTLGQMSNLNVSVATGIMMYEWGRQNQASS